MSNLIEELFCANRMLRGELWVAESVLVNFPSLDQPNALVNYAMAINANVCFFDYTNLAGTDSKNMIPFQNAVDRAHVNGLACGALIDGPFERLVRNLGFFKVMQAFRDDSLLNNLLHEQTIKVNGDIELAKSSNVDMCILCDDIAYKQGPYFSPQVFSQIFAPLYRDLIKVIGPEIIAGFHSDGNLSLLFPKLQEIGFTMFSLEPEAMDLVNHPLCITGLVTLLTGIKASWLTAPEWGQRQLDEIKKYISHLRRRYRLILASTCGIQDMQSMRRLQDIYQTVL